MRDGWIRLHRILLDKAVWKTTTSTFHSILIAILLLANYKENQWVWDGKKYKCAPGEFITSASAIAKLAGIDVTAPMVRRALKSLTDKWLFLSHTTSLSRSHGGTKITILNWSEYQLSENVKGNTVGNSDVDRGVTGGSTNKKEKKKEKNFSPTSDEVRLSNLLFNLMRKNNSEVKKPNTQSWAKIIDLMIRIDKRDPEDIERIIGLSQADPFWCTNILSASKLRSQFDQLSVKLITRNQAASVEGESLPPGFFVRPLDIVPDPDHVYPTNEEVEAHFKKTKGAIE